MWIVTAQEKNAKCYQCTWLAIYATPTPNWLPWVDSALSRRIKAAAEVAMTKGLSK